MGISGLTKVISDNAPNAIQDIETATLFNRKIAIDASMYLYQFLIAVRPDSINNLTDGTGDTTSHLHGLLYRSIRLLENGIKPVYVFDGKAPVLKSGELEKRKKKREQAEEAIKSEQLEDLPNLETVAKSAKRMVKVSARHVEESKHLLGLMGITCVQAPEEAESQCADLVRKGLCYGTSSEDMDSLTFGTEILLRDLGRSESQKIPIRCITLSRVLTEMNFTMDQFIDFCILLGCDYCDTIRGIGPVRALELIRNYKNLEGIIKNIDKSKYQIPENWENIQAVRELFKNPNVLPDEELVLHCEEPNYDELLKYLLEKGFDQKRVESAIERMKATRGGLVQNRITTYFGNSVPTPKKDNKGNDNNNNNNNSKSASSTKSKLEKPKLGIRPAKFKVGRTIKKKKKLFN